MNITNQTTAAEARAAADDQQRILDRGREVLRRESAAIGAAEARLGSEFVRAVQMVLDCPGRIAVTGMGKAGLIGNKIQATLSSTGTPAYALHPVEALHGDLGMIRPEDVVLALTRSGETQELRELLPRLSRIGCSIVLLTARSTSRCAALADVVLDIGQEPEACPLGLAPSSSTAAMVALGDALALVVMELKNVKPEQYARYHPAGALGRSLMTVREIMRTGDDCPTVALDGTLHDYYQAVQRAPRRAGAAAVVDRQGCLAGFVTHGDVFRLLASEDGAPPSRKSVADVMTPSPKTASPELRVADAIKLMQAHLIDELPVIEQDRRVVGMVDVQDLLAQGFSVFDDQ